MPGFAPPPLRPMYGRQLATRKSVLRQSRLMTLQGKFIEAIAQSWWRPEGKKKTTMFSQLRCSLVVNDMIS